jgi:L-aspartate oxidase
MVLEHDWDTVRRVMWDYVGILRERERLEIALSRLRNIRRTVERIYRHAAPDPALAELRNIALLGELIVLCARARRESRGLHATVDHPGKAPGPPQDSVIARDLPLAGERAWEPGADPEATA